VVSWKLTSLILQEPTAFGEGIEHMPTDMMVSPSDRPPGWIAAGSDRHAPKTVCLVRADSIFCSSRTSQRSLIPLTRPEMHQDRAVASHMDIELAFYLKRATGGILGHLRAFLWEVMHSTPQFHPSTLIFRAG
jgi:hypothetical protein